MNTMEPSGPPLVMAVTNLRHAYPRGEIIDVSLRLSCIQFDPLDECTITLSADGRELAAQPLGRIGINNPLVHLSFNSALLRPGRYKADVAVTAGDTVCATLTWPFTVTKRLPDDGIPLWHWPSTAYYNSLTFDDKRARRTIDTMAACGFTWIALPGPWAADHPEPAARLVEYALEKGLAVGALLPNEGAWPYRPEGLPEEALILAPSGERLPLAWPEHPAVQARTQEEAARVARFFAPFPSFTHVFMNSELEDRLKLNLAPGARELHEKRLGFSLDELDNLDVVFQEPASEADYVQPGVIADNDRRYRCHRYYYLEGDGWTVTNRLAAGAFKALRPDTWTISDPFRLCALPGRFDGLDTVSTWTYTNPDPKFTLFAETLRAAAASAGRKTMHTISLFNYAGTLVPSGTNRFERRKVLCMGPDRLKECAWLNLSRGVDGIGIYFSSQLEPILGKDPPDVLSPKTATALGAFARKVLAPFGALARAARPVPRRVAVLDALASRVYAESPRLLGHYPNYQVYSFYTLLAMAHFPADIVFEEDVAAGALDRYDALALPKGDTLTESVYRNVCAFAARGGVVMADGYLRAELPGAIRFDFDFTYRRRVNANALATGRDYAVVDDTNFRKTWGETAAEGVTADEDREIMEGYAARLRAALDGKIARAFDVRSPRAICNLMEFGAARYLFAVNDHRGYDQRTGRYRSILEKGLPLRTKLTVRKPWKSLFIYDLLRHAPVAFREEGECAHVPLSLPAAGGTILALVPEKIARVDLSLPKQGKPGESHSLDVTVRGESGAALSGLYPVQLTVLDPLGREADLSGPILLRDGRRTLSWVPALNDPAGTWRVSAVDLTSGLRAESTVVVDGPRPGVQG